MHGDELTASVSVLQKDFNYAVGLKQVKSDDLVNYIIV